MKFHAAIEKHQIMNQQKEEKEKNIELIQEVDDLKMKCSELKSAVQTKDKNTRKQIEELKTENTELRVRSEVDADGYSV